jgi:uracil-DNA glycosylase
VLGLAPAAHGANRTGRIFTGDGLPDVLMHAMYGAVFASIPTSRHDKNGLADAYNDAVVRCAPPENKPTSKEIANCQPDLKLELAALTRLRVVVSLRKVVFDAYWRLMAALGLKPQPRKNSRTRRSWSPRGGLSW